MTDRNFSLLPKLKKNLNLPNKLKDKWPILLGLRFLYTDLRIGGSTALYICGMIDREIGDLDIYITRECSIIKRLCL